MANNKVKGNEKHLFINNSKRYNSKIHVFYKEHRWENKEHNQAMTKVS